MSRDDPMKFHDWAELFGWNGTGEPLRPPNCAWNPSTRAKLMASWALHKLTQCAICDRAAREELIRILEHGKGNASNALGLLAAATISDVVPLALRQEIEDLIDRLEGLVARFDTHIQKQEKAP